MAKTSDTSRSSAWISSRYRWLVAGVVLVGCYILFTSFFLRPLPAHFNTATPAGGFSSDQCQTIWFFWWTQTALTHAELSLYNTDYLYYPYGTGLGYHLCPLTNLIALGFGAALGLEANSPALFNLMIYFAFVLNGIASFLLLRLVTGRNGPAFIASLLITFAPYRLWNLDHLNLLSTGWALLAVVAALSYIKYPKTINMAGAVAALVATFYTSLTNMMIALMFLGVCVIVFNRTVLRSPERKRLITRALIGIAATVLLILPGLLQLDRVAAQWEVDWQDIERYSPDALDFVLPTGQERATGRGEVLLGWYCLALAIVAVSMFRSKDVVRWGLVAASLLVLSLGPTLLVSGHRYLAGLMPYRWLYEIVPYFDLARTPARLVVGVQWALAIMAAYAIAGWTKMLGYIPATAWRYLAVAVIYGGSVLAIGLEFASQPIPLVPMQVPPVYREVSSDQEINVLCDLPIREKLQISNWYMYWQTFHERKAVNGYLTHRSAASTALIDQIKEWDSIDEEQLHELRVVGVDAVVLHQPGQAARLIRLAKAVEADDDPH